MAIYKTTTQPDDILTTGNNRPTLPQFGKKGGIFTDCILVMLNVKDDDDL